MIPSESPQQPPLLLMLDYDGTLSPLHLDFADARITPERIDFLRRLANTPGVLLAIVSGRSVAQLQEFLAPLAGETMFLVGLHGGEVYDYGRDAFIVTPSATYKEGVAKLKAHLINQGIDQLDGIAFEDKGFSLGLHYARASEEVAHIALTAFNESLAPLGLGVDFILRPGKKLLEAVPKGFNKGVGIHALISLATQRLGGKPDLLYIGDDVTDFDAFAVVLPLGGRCYFVGATLPPESPPVNGLLPNVDAVYTFLEDTIHPVQIAPSA